METCKKVPPIIAHVVGFVYEDTQAIFFTCPVVK